MKWISLISLLLGGCGALNFDAGNEVQARRDFVESREECHRRAVDVRMGCGVDCQGVPYERRCLEICDATEKESKKRCDF